MSPEHVAWLAGILEGEGSFMIHRSRAKGVLYPKPRIQVSMSDEDVIRRLAYLLRDQEGESYAVMVQPKRSGRNHHSTMYRVAVNGSRAEEIMRLVRPWMGERRGARIDEILETFNKPAPTRRG